MKKLTALAIIALSMSALTGCWQSPANCSLVIGYHAEKVRLAEGSSGSTTNTVSGYGNNARVYIRQSNVAYKSPATSSSNNVSPTLEIPLTK